MTPKPYRSTGCIQTGIVRVERWEPRPPVAAWLVGRTEQGRTVEIMGDPYCDERSTIHIDGKAPVVIAIDRLRDGGTTRIKTDCGLVVRPTPFKPERMPTLDGHVIYDDHD